MANFESIFRKETKKAELHPKRITKWIHYSKLKDNPSQYCDEADQDEIVALADLIEADGEVLQDLLVRKTDVDEYEIIAGHKRRRACRLLVEERGKEEFALLPCVVKNVSDVRAEFQLYSSNGHHEKTAYEIMHELERMKYLLENYPEEFPHLQTGRMVERLAKQFNMKKTTVGEYQAIANNLGEKGMDKFREGELKKSAALELAGLTVKEQDRLVEEGRTSLREIREYKQERLDREKNLPAEATLDEANIKQDLPELKNTEQRKEWLRNYRDWGIWYEDNHIGVKYYKYDFSNGARLIVEEYEEYSMYVGDFFSSYFHLVGGPEPPKGKYGVGKWNRHKNYSRHADSETELIEFLKFIQKGGC